MACCQLVPEFAQRLANTLQCQYVHVFAKNKMCQNKNHFNWSSSREKYTRTILEPKQIIHQRFGIMLRFRIPARLKKFTFTRKFIPVVVGAKNANADELSQTAGIAKETVSYVVVII